MYPFVEENGINCFYSAIVMIEVHTEDEIFPGFYPLSGLHLIRQVLGINHSDRALTGRATDAS
jgi:hypothetical protein